MHDPTLREEMENFYTYLREVLQVDRITIPSKDYDLVLDITAAEEQKISWSYYYACHESRCLFWLKTYDARFMVSELFGVNSPAHVSALPLLHSNLPQFSLVLCTEQRFEALYWRVGHILPGWCHNG
jgi:hypothetical protein